MDLSYKKLGELLITNKLLTEQQVQDALAMQKQSPARLGEIATAMGWASEKDISGCLAEQYGYDLVDPTDVECSEEALAAMSYHRALKNLTLPIKIESSQLHCVIADPINVVAIDELRSAQRFPLKITVAPASELREAIIRNYVDNMPQPKPQIKPEPKVESGAETKSEDQFEAKAKPKPKPQRPKVKIKNGIDDQSDRLALLHALSYEIEIDASAGRRGW